MAKLGSQRTNPGKYVIKNSTRTSATMNGHASRANSPMDIFANAQTTYMIVPTGGVIVPIIMFRTSTTPKCTKSMWAL